MVVQHRDVPRQQVESGGDAVQESVRESLDVIYCFLPAGRLRKLCTPRRRGVLGGWRKAPDPFLW
jgi:hypothetical protein